MAEPRNAKCFSQPHWQVIAQGSSTESWFGDGTATGSGGIVHPKRIHLRVGQRYYRFASATAPRRGQVGGGWWIEYEPFSIIRNFAREHSYELTDAARLFLALPYDWTRVDRLVSAILEVPLDAYAGHGKVAEGRGQDDRDRDTKWVPIQHQPVTQLYIPGLVSVRTDPARKEPDLYESAFPDPKFEFLHTRKPAPSPR